MVYVTKDGKKTIAEDLDQGCSVLLRDVNHNEAPCDQGLIQFISIDEDGKPTFYCEDGFSLGAKTIEDYFW